MAKENWSNEVRTGVPPPPFRPDLVEKIYAAELGGGPAAQRLKRVMLLEISQYLENYLWPHFDADTATEAHVMSILVRGVLHALGALQGAQPGKSRAGVYKLCCHALRTQVMVNEKFREGVLAWAGFASRPDVLPSLFARIYALRAPAAGPGGRAWYTHERVTYLLFAIHAFQSLENEAVRRQVLRLVSLPLWYALSRGRLQVPWPAILALMRCVACIAAEHRPVWRSQLAVRVRSASAQRLACPAARVCRSRRRCARAVGVADTRGAGEALA